MKEKIKSLRLENGATLEESAKACGIAKSYLWELENNDKLRPSFETIRKIARCFYVSLDYFAGDACLTTAQDAHFVNEYLATDEKTKSKTRKVFQVLKE